MYQTSINQRKTQLAFPTRPRFRKSRTQGSFVLSLCAPTHLPLQVDWQFSDSAGILLKCRVWFCRARMEAEIRRPKHTRWYTCCWSVGHMLASKRQNTGAHGNESVWPWSTSCLLGCDCKKTEKQKIVIVGKDAEKLERLCTVDTNRKLCSQYGKQSNVSSKN